MSLSRTATLALLTLAIGLGAAACAAPPEAPSAAPLPTRTLRPTFTTEPTPLPATATPPPTATPVPPTPTTAPFVTVAQNSVNVRTGPGNAYPLVGTVSSGQQLPVVGKSADGNWWQICCVEGKSLWISASLVETGGSIQGVAVVNDIPPLPTAPPVVQIPQQPIQQPVQPPVQQPVQQFPTQPPPPTPRPQPTQPPPPPTQPPAPVFAFSVGGMEGRVNTNNRLSVWARIWEVNSRTPLAGYTVRVRGNGTYEGKSSTPLQRAYGGITGSEFEYNVKIEASPYPGDGNYTAQLIGPDGQEAGPPISFSAGGTNREFILTWNKN